MDVKPPTTYEEQVDLIQGKGFVVSDAADCENFLKEANYYRLSAYFLPFRNPDGTYFQGINFDRIRRIYEFDSHIRSLTFQTIEHIEFFLRTQIAYYCGHKYGALGYLDPSIFSEKHKAENFDARLKQCIEENRRTLVVKHHKEKYDGKFPLWVIIEFFSIGMLSYFYGDLKSPDKKAIAQEAFASTPSNVISWLRCITDLRNRCAHYARLYYWSFPAVPRMLLDISYKADHRLFSQIMVLKFLYPNKSTWNNHIVTEIEALIEQYSKDISLKHIGFPENWKSLLEA